MDIAVTGGIGSGKSTVARMLADKGGVHLDADAIVHELQQPGTALFKAMVENFGQAIVAEDGTLDRQAMAEIAFSDATQLRKLNQLVHPAVRAEMQARRDALKRSGAKVISEIPLLVEGQLERAKQDAGGRGGQDAAGSVGQDAAGSAGQDAGGSTGPTSTDPQFDAIIVVVADQETALSRLEQRGLPRQEALARMSKQASDTQRRAAADYVIDNSGTLAQLSQAIDRCWEWLAKAAA